MIDINLIRKRGGSAEALRKKFEAEEYSPKLQRFVDLQIARIKAGVSRNMSYSREFWAVDQAFDAPQRQVSQTLVQGLFEKNLSADQLSNVVGELGLTRMLTDVYDTNGHVMNGSDGQPMKGLNLPTFFHVFVPLVAAYVKIRWAKLFNERNLFPLYRYNPASLTRINRIKSEIITSSIQRMAQNMGYKSIERQSILYMLMYSRCINFPVEPYFKEEQLVSVEEGDPRSAIVKEGVRYHVPHPSRVYYDQAHPLSTVNTDTGVTYGGYWDVKRFGELFSDGASFWNLDKIGIDAKSVFRGGSKAQRAYEMMFPCVAEFPWSSDPSRTNDRQGEAFRYSTDRLDDGVHVAIHYVKVVPREWDLFDYEHPVWMRLVIAGETKVIYCEPIAYPPMVAYLYDDDTGKANSSSLALELIPFQDQTTNMFSQYILSVRRNLDRTVFFDKDKVDAKDIEALRTADNRPRVESNFVPFSGTARRHAGLNSSNPFQAVDRHQVNTAEIAASISLFLNILERLIGFSPQEVGAVSSHEQSATEVSLTAQGVSSRTDLTSSFVDEGIHARKNQLYLAMRAYGSKEVVAEVPAGSGITTEDIEKAGFEVDETSADLDTKIGVRAQIKHLDIDGFSTDREGRNRVTDSRVASTMIQTFQVMFSQPQVVEVIGVTKLIQFFNQVLQYTGVPKDFRLQVPEGENAEVQSSQIIQQFEALAHAIQQNQASVQQLADATATQITNQGNQLGEALQQLQAENGEQNQAIAKITEIISSVAGQPIT